MIVSNIFQSGVAFLIMILMLFFDVNIFRRAIFILKNKKTISSLRYYITSYSNEEYLSADSFLNLKGILAVSVLCVHFSSYPQNPGLFYFFNHFGYLAVALFFLISGYGLAYSATNKINYLKGANFILIRLPKILFPYWITLVFCTVVKFVLGSEISIRTFVFALFSTNGIVGGSWYLFENLFFYILFFFIYKIKNIRVATVVLGVAVFLSIIIFKLVGFEKEWFRSMLPFYVGIVLGQNFKKVNSVFRNIKKYYLAIFLFVILFGITAILRIVCINYNFEWFQVVFDNLSCSTFAVLVILALYKIKIGNKLTRFLGGDIP